MKAEDCRESGGAEENRMRLDEEFIPKDKSDKSGSIVSVENRRPRPISISASPTLRQLLLGGGSEAEAWATRLTPAVVVVVVVL